MPRHLVRLSLLVACAIIFQLVISQQLHAADNADASAKAAQLEQLRKRIGKLKNELQGVRDTRNARQAALEKTDKAISKVSAQLHDSGDRIQAAEKQLSALEKALQSERRKLAGMSAQLEKELRASYMAGRQQQVKLLLNQEDPASLGRMLIYQGYITRARSTRLQEYNEVLAHLQDTEQSLRGQRDDLEQLYGEQQAQADELAQAQTQQRTVLTRIERQLGNKSAELETLQQDEMRLGKLVASLRRALQDMPLDKLDRPLKTLQGKLAWPVTGKLTRRFGSPLGGGKARSRGVLIATRPDTDVHAIAKGRVVFADWLRGFGLLMIIEHGDGYMSLYGRNNSLYRGVGEWVDRGEVVAAAGSSGGQQQSGLYLELRKDGRPLDPGGWFRGKPRTQTAARR